jgi:hypothetical protein
MGKANASLISNAPALFKAVQGYMDTVNNALSTFGDQVIAMAEVEKVMQNIRDEKFYGDTN